MASKLLKTRTESLELATELGTMHFGGELQNTLNTIASDAEKLYHQVQMKVQNKINEEQMVAFLSREGVMFNFCPFAVYHVSFCLICFTASRMPTQNRTCPRDTSSDLP